MGIAIKLYLWVRKHVLNIDDRSFVEIAIDNGMVLGKNANIQDGVVFDPSHCWLIEIGDNVTIAPRVHILAHDASTKLGLGYTKVGKVKVGNNVFIGANTTILPGVTVGDSVIIGANSVVTHDIPSKCVAVGNPCKVIKLYEDYIQENEERFKSAPVFGEDYLINNITKEKKDDMKEKLESSSIGFIV